jgi:hypothetical protein
MVIEGQIFIVSLIYFSSSLRPVRPESTATSNNPATQPNKILHYFFDCKREAAI